MSFKKIQTIKKVAEAIKSSMFFSIYSSFILFPIPTVCPGSSDPPEKIFSIFASENEVYNIYQL